ncbi:amino acid transporter [Luteimicrobium subarcticum]|uniref:amino acid transporter n=1 Tax=Luteimicrobium subarcticum TaxID=620910 RepID=UPI001FEB65E4|nr:amino acid transporter [Luteimicrobium subarcticum]
MSERAPAGRLQRFLLEGYERRPAAQQGPHGLPAAAEGRRRPWWAVMTLSGVDYFSTLGYQPGIAVLAAGVLAPFATVVLVALTLCGALPVYRRVARDSPHGEGSIAMLEHLLPWWAGKLFVLALLGFAATDFVITMTLSAADAAQHAVENPLFRDVLHGHQMTVTLVLLALLAGVFLKGFREAIALSVPIVAVYLALNVVVIGVALGRVVTAPHVVVDWTNLVHVQYSSVFAVVGVSLLVFPKLALGLSGFETGVAVMPEIQGGPDDTESKPVGRIVGAKKLLTTSALIMSVLLIASSFVTTVLVPADALESGGPANGRALAYVAHEYLGSGFGSVYDIATILILWFAGASAMAGLLNLVPRYLPRYGMAPEWTRARRPLVLVFLLVGVVITLLFRADVDAQGGAYATGVLVLITSASVACTVSAHRAGQRRARIGFGVVAAVFVYTTVDNMVERPDGLKIGLIFVAAIVILSAVSRVGRSFRLRDVGVELDDTARAIVDADRGEPVQLVAHEPPDAEDVPLTPRAREAALAARPRRSFREGSTEYAAKAESVRRSRRVPEDVPLVFLEVDVVDSSEFEERLQVRGEYRYGYPVLRVTSSNVASTLASVALAVRDRTGVPPELYIEWEEGNPMNRMSRYLLFGTGEVGPVSREILRSAEPDVGRRPPVHVG